MTQKQDTVVGNEQLPEPDDDFNEPEFHPCSRCDGHPACEDFGCAFELGCGRQVRKSDPLGLDAWS